jgi:hypothetical protein
MKATKVVSAVVTTTAFRSKDQHDARCGLVDKVLSIAAAGDLPEVDKRDWAVIAGSNSIQYLCTVYREPNISSDGSRMICISLYNHIVKPVPLAARSKRRGSAAAHLLRSWDRIPPEAWMFVCCECCVLSGRGLCDELITRPEESYRLWYVVMCDLGTSRMRRP